MENIEYPLPDGAMRYSLYSAWKKDKVNAMKTFFPDKEEDRKHLYTPWVKFGSFIAEQLELRPVPEWLSDVPVLDKKSEYRIIINIDGVMVRGTIDLFDLIHLTVEDVKSSKEKWTQVKLRKLDQLVFYQVLVEELFGFVNPLTTVHNILVQMNDDGSISRTDDKCITLPYREVAEFERQRMREDMVKVAKEISIAYQNYKKGLIVL